MSVPYTLLVPLKLGHVTNQDTFLGMSWSQVLPTHLPCQVREILCLSTREYVQTKQVRDDQKEVGKYEGTDDVFRACDLASEAHFRGANVDLDLFPYIELVVCVCVCVCVCVPEQISVLCISPVSCWH